MLRIVLLLIAFTLLSSVAFAKEDKFDNQSLDKRLWCPCQIDMKHAPVSFPNVEDAGDDRVLHIPVDGLMVGGNVCRYDEDECSINDSVPPGSMEVESVAPLGPSLRDFIQAPSGAESEHILVGKVMANPHCTLEIQQQADNAEEEGKEVNGVWVGDCIQRQELRLHTKYRHEMSDPHLYKMRFLLPHIIQDRKNSVRWVNFQWKQTSVATEYGDASPFLAQRFDDGVLHVTVQQEHCRCVVASAPFSDGSTFKWKSGPAQYCLSSHPDDGQNTPCRKPHTLKLEFDRLPILVSPNGEWVEMKYRVQSGLSEKVYIEVFQISRPGVTVRGGIGYKTHPNVDAKVKFKF